VPLTAPRVYVQLAGCDVADRYNSSALESNQWDYEYNQCILLSTSWEENLLVRYVTAMHRDTSRNVV